MNDELISVVVPVYKVEKYLDKCVESIVAQTYNKLEIILVDDGSPDKCPVICDEWAEKDSRIVVIHQQNAGLSEARNAGVRAASGRYIGFVDSDDYIAHNMYETLYSAIKKYDADIAICNLIYLDEYGNPVDENIKSPIKNELLNKEQAFQKLDMRNTNYWYYVTACNKLYKKEILEKVAFRVGKINEDEFSIHLFFDIASKIVTIDDSLYFYIQHKGSIMTATFTQKRFNIIEAYFERYNFFCKKNYIKLADTTLILIYAILLQFMTIREVRSYKKDLEIWVKIIFLELARKRNLRAVKLAIYYLIFLLRL